MRTRSALSLSFSAKRFDAQRLFYGGAATVLLVLTFFGFQHFYLHGQAYPGRELAAPIRPLLILHGSVMTGWVLLFLIQPLLIVTGKRRLHRALGTIGAGLAAAMVVLGFRLGIESARISPPELRIWDLPPKQFLAVPILSVLIFAGLVTLGVAQRRRPEVHRPVMLLATLSIMSAAISRIDAFSDLYRTTLWANLFGPFFSTLVVGVLLLGIQWLIGSLNRWFAIGLAASVALDAGIMQLAPTAIWARFAGFLLG